MKQFVIIFIGLVVSQSLSWADSYQPLYVFEKRLFNPPTPSSELIGQQDPDLNPAFCAQWNPDFAFKGNRCCGKTPWKYRRRGIRCTPSRAKKSFCDEMTDDQREYIRNVNSGKIPDILKHLEGNFGRHGTQAFCTPNTGFLAWGRPIVATHKNRLHLRRPGRCVNFGTDRMAALVEWLGHRIREKYQAEEYHGVRLLVGDTSAPRGGCLAGKGGRRGHASHMSGQDIDLGFLSVKKNEISPIEFRRRFDAKANLWLLKNLFRNPYVCIDSVFLDWRHIRKLRKVAGSDPEWIRIQPHVRHVRRHRNHYHIRIGRRPGAPGCESTEKMSPPVQTARIEK